MKSRSENALFVDAVSQEFSSELLTPFIAYQAIQKRGLPCFLFEGAEDEKTPDRYTYLGFDAERSLTVSKGSLTVKTAKGLREIAGNPLDELKRILARFQPVPGAPVSKAGVVGYVGYDCVRYLEKIALPGADSEVPEASIHIFQNHLVFDHAKQRLKIIRHIIGPRPATASMKRQAFKEIAKVRGIILKHPAKVTLEPDQKPTDKHLQKFLAAGTGSTKEEFVAAVGQVKKHIRQGDIFQCVLSRPFTFKLDADPFDVYRVLRSTNPSSYHFYLNIGDQVLLGASPEMLVKVHGGIVETTPIAGTRRRVADEKMNKKLEKQLLASPKERAEHIMLVDLSRNDLGRVCQPGTVRVTRYMAIKHLSHVMHITSLVEGKLRRNLTPLDAFFSCFPAGTLSGAPKVRAMQIISDLEKNRRGFYGGAVLMGGFDGSLDSCIAIRCMSVRKGIATIQAGAGVVADSTAEREYQEIADKTKALRNAVASAELV